MEDDRPYRAYRKVSEVPEAVPRFKAGDTARRIIGGRQVVIRGLVPFSPESLRAHAIEGAPPPTFEYECYWFEGMGYRAGVVFEFELEDEADF